MKPFFFASVILLFHTVAQGGSKEKLFTLTALSQKSSHEKIRSQDKLKKEHEKELDFVDGVIDKTYTIAGENKHFTPVTLQAFMKDQQEKKNSFCAQIIRLFIQDKETSKKRRSKTI